jgi:hypothetical protein
MPEIVFQKLKATRDGVSASTGKQTEVAFNENFDLVKTCLDDLFTVVATAVTSENITQIKVNSSTNPPKIYYTTDDPAGEVTWTQIVTSFADIQGNPTDNIALNTALNSKASATDVSTLQTQMTAAQGNISNLQTTVAGHTTSIGTINGQITTINSNLNDRVRVPHGDTLYLRKVVATNTIEYSEDGSTWVSMSTLAPAFSGITGNASDNTSLVNYVAGQITNAMNTVTSTYATQAALTSHTTNQNNPHNVTKTQLGLGNVDNTADIDKPVSNAVQAALDAIVVDAVPTHNVTPAGYRSSAPTDNALYLTSNSYLVQQQEQEP